MKNTNEPICWDGSWYKNKDVALTKFLGFSVKIPHRSERATLLNGLNSLVKQFCLSFCGIMSVG